MNEYEIASAVVDEYITLLHKKYDGDEFKYPSIAGHLQEVLMWVAMDGVDAIQNRINRLKNDKEITNV